MNAEGTFQLGEPWFLCLGILVPLALAWGTRRRRRARVRFPSLSLVRGLPRGWRHRLRFLPTLLEGLALAGLITALARPLSGKEEVLLESEGVDIVLVVDRSGSMTHQDMAEGKSRLAVAKEVVGRFVEARTRDRLALVVFARFADLRCPPTLDGEALLDFLEDVQPALVEGEDGTAVGVGLARAVEVLRGSSAKSRVVVLLTDGENNVADVEPLEAAQFAKAEGVRVYTIAAGRFVFGYNPFAGGLVATEGELDTRELEAIAQTTGGRFYRAHDADALQGVYEEIDRLEKTPIEDRRFTDFTDLYPFVLLPSLFVYFAAHLARSTVLRSYPS
jgi:Ca-activated chloride channel family protein